MGIVAYYRHYWNYKDVRKDNYYLKDINIKHFHNFTKEKVKDNITGTT